MLIQIAHLKNMCYIIYVFKNNTGVSIMSEKSFFALPFLAKCKKIAGLLAKIAIAGAIVWYMFLRDPDKIIKSLSSFSYLYLIPAMLLYVSHMVYCSFRWRKLADILKVKLSVFEAVSLTFQGYFFSLVIPGGAIGGDVVKMGAVSKRSQHGEKAEGAFTVLMDRIIGMIALFTLSLVIIFPAYKLLLNVSIPDVQLSLFAKKLLVAAVVLLCFSGLAASMVIFFHKQVRRIAWIDKLFVFGNKVTRGMVDRLIAATDVYASQWKSLLRLVTESVFLVHLMTVVPLFFILSGMGVEYSIFSIIVAVTIGNIAGLLPIFPAGVGGRDVITVMIMISSGIPEANAQAAMLIYTAILLVFNLSGGLFFIFDPGHKLSSYCEKENK